MGTKRAAAGSGGSQDSVGAAPAEEDAPSRYFSSTHASRWHGFQAIGKGPEPRVASPMLFQSSPRSPQPAEGRESAEVIEGTRHSTMELALSALANLVYKSPDDQHEARVCGALSQAVKLLSPGRHFRIH